MFAVAILVAGSFLTVNAQWEFGARGGISIPNLSARGSEKNPLNSGYSSRLGPDFGVFGEYHVTKLFSLELAPEYSSQGGKKDGTQALATPAQLAAAFEEQGQPVPTYLYADYNSEARINYLLIPVLAKFGWNLGSKSPFRLYVAAGPYVGFLLSAKQVTSGNSPIYADENKSVQITPAQSFDASTSIKDQLHSANFGVDGRVGLSWAIGPKQIHHVFVEAGGNYGFVNIQKGTANGKNNTGAAVATIGYSIAVGRHARS